MDVLDVDAPQVDLGELMAKRPGPIDHDALEVMESRLEAKIQELMPRRQPRTDWTRSVQLLVALISIAALVFAAGSWRGKSETVETRLTNVEVAVQQLIKQQADQKTDSAVMLQKIDQVVNTVSEIKGQMQQRPTTPVR